MTELSLVDASGVRQTRTQRPSPRPTGASAGQPTVRSRDFARQVTVDTTLQASPLGQLAGVLGNFFGDRAKESQKADLGKRQADYLRNVARITTKINENPQKAADAIKNRDFDFLLGPGIDFKPQELEDATYTLLGEKFANEALDDEFLAGLESLPDNVDPEAFTAEFIADATEGAQPLFAAAYGTRLLRGSARERSLVQQTRRNRAQLQSLELGITAYERRLADENWVVGANTAEIHLNQIIAGLPNKNIPAIASAKLEYAKSTFRAAAAGNVNAI